MGAEPSQRSRGGLSGAVIHPDDGAGLQVDRVLGLVREVRAAVLHLRDARVGVVRMPPVGAAALLRAWDEAKAGNREPASY